MKIRSTGLGKTLLTAQVGTVEITRVDPATLDPSDSEPTRLLMTMEVVEPIHWTVRAFLEPADLRRLIKIVLTRPRTLFGALIFLFSQGPKSKPETSEAEAVESKPEAPEVKAAEAE